MVELIQLVDESLARHGFEALLPTRPTSLHSSLGASLFMKTEDPGALNGQLFQSKKELRTGEVSTGLDQDLEIGRRGV
jgi:hypothetical protein